MKIGKLRQGISILHKRGELITDCISTSHALAKELLSKPDSFITVTIEEKEYVIDSIRRKFTYANFDDSVMYLTLNLRDGGNGNIKR